MPLIRFTPLYKTRVWGGRQLAEAFGRTLPEGAIGEGWEIVDRAEDQSMVADGQYKGMTIKELLGKHGKAILGQAYQTGAPFPILVKWLDCRERLSLQVHPPAHKAAALKGEPKTECWYIAVATPTAGVFAGLKKGATKEKFEAALKANTLEPLCHRLPTQAGDFIFIPSGRLHAIDGGNLILEIQQNSDTTYRVYDWGRPRELHIQQSLESTDFNDFEPSLAGRTAANVAKLVEDKLFSVTRYTIKAGEKLTLPARATASILSLTEGQLEGIAPGENLLLPASESVTLAALKTSTLITTTDFIK